MRAVQDASEGFLISDTHTRAIMRAVQDASEGFLISDTHTHTLL